MTDRPKSIVEALAEVQRKVNEQRADRLANMMEAMPVPARRGEGVTGVALANQGISRENRRDQAYVDSVFGAGKMKAGSAESNLALLKHAKNNQGSQTPAGNGNVTQGKTAAPVAPASSGEKGVATATAIANTDKAIETNAKNGTSSQLAGAPKSAENVTPAQQITANRDAGAAGGTTMGSPRQFGTIAAAGDAGKAGDDSARAAMPAAQRDKIDSEASARQADMNAEREKNIAAQAAKRADAAPAPSQGGTPPAPTPRPTAPVAQASSDTSTAANDVGSRLGGGNRTPNRTPAPTSDSPSMFSKVKDFFTKPTETKVGDNGIEPESGPKGKKKMSESALIDAFLKLQETNHPNIFEAAKKAKKDYDGDGKIESGKDEYLGSRIAAAKKAGKMEEELKGDQKKIDANNNGKIDGDDFRKLRSGKKSEKMKAYRADRDKHGEMEEAAYPPGVSGKDTAKDKDPDMLKGSPDDEAAEKKIPTPPKKPAEMKEETFPGFSESEIAHFEAVIARKDQKGKDRGPGDVVASEDLTDEYINEMARKPGENRGVKAGVPRGPYKGKAHKGGADAKGDSMPDEGPKGVPHVLDQIRHGREDEQGFKTITHPASSPEAPVTKSIHRSELHGFYDQYHNTEKPAAKEKAYAGFLGKHFDGDTRTSAPTSQSVTTDLSKIEKSNLKGGSKVSLGGSKLVGGKK